MIKTGDSFDHGRVSAVRYFFECRAVFAFEFKLISAVRTEVICNWPVILKMRNMKIPAQGTEHVRCYLGLGYDTGLLRSAVVFFR